MKLLNLLLYCTKANKYERLVRDEHYGKPFYLCGAITENFESLNGKIVAECDFGYDNIPDEFEKYQNDKKFMNLKYNEGLMYIAIQETLEDIELEKIKG